MSALRKKGNVGPDDALKEVYRALSGPGTSTLKGDDEPS